MLTLRLPAVLVACVGCSLALSTDEYREPLSDASSSDANDESDSQDPDAGGDTGNLPDAAMDVCAPSPEMCNGVSDDCDDAIDEGTCMFPGTQATCEPGGCVVTGCDPGFFDCSDAPGCETTSDRTNCGECGMTCAATEGCQADICVEPTLDWWWAVDHGPNDREVFISSGLEQRYLLTRVASSSSPLVVTRSTGAPITFSDGSRDVALLVAVDESGREIWQVRLSAESLSTAAISSIEGADGVFIAGTFQGRLTANGSRTDVELNSAGTNRDGFVLRIDALGSVRRIAQLTDRAGGDGSQTINDMAVSADGTVFVVGSSTSDFTTITGGSSVLAEVPVTGFPFILRLGTRSTAIPTPRANWESVTADGENVYVGMRLEDTVMLGGAEYSDDRFVPLIASYDHDLALRWVQTPILSTGGQGEDERLRVHAGNGSVYLSHTFDQMHNFGGSMVAAGGFVASLSASDGAVAWARQLGTLTPAISTARDQVFFGGGGTGAIDLGGGSLGTAVGIDALVGVLQPSGAYESARLFGGLDREFASHVHPTSTGIMVSGQWVGVMSIDGVNLDAPSNRNLFVLHFSTEN